MSTIKISNLIKSFGKTEVIKNMDLVIEDGWFVTFLGPSGCGKTTTLRCISGLETPDEGKITVDGKAIFSSTDRINLPPGNRSLGLVFQNYALWPHMTVRQNISFGLYKSGLTKVEKDQKVSHVIEVMGLDNLGERYPHELSGGQQQRVSVARMVVVEPGILLFDEPLSNLDAKLRMKLRSELKRLHHELKATTVYVTHDQVEALALSDQIVVMNEGVIQQIGSPYEVYHFPKNLFVADFMGNPQTNLVDGEIIRKTGGTIDIRLANGTEVRVNPESATGLMEGMKVVINIRPEDIKIIRDCEDSQENYEIYTTQPMGSEILFHLITENRKLELILKIPEDQSLDLKAEMKVGIQITRGNIMDEKSGVLVASFGF